MDYKRIAHRKRKKITREEYESFHNYNIECNSQEREKE